MPFDAAVMTHLNLSGVHYRHPRTLTKTTVQIDTQGYQGRRHPFDKTLITYQPREGSKPLPHDLIEVKPFEIPVMGLVKCNCDRHNFTQAQLTMTLAVFKSIPH